MRSQGSGPVGGGRQCGECGVRRRAAGLWWGWCAECWSEKFRVLTEEFLREGLSDRVGAGGVQGAKSLFLASAVGLFRGALTTAVRRPVFRRACVEGAVRAVLDVYPLLLDHPDPDPVPDPVRGLVVGSGSSSDPADRGRAWGCVERLDQWATVFERVADTETEEDLRREAAGIARHTRARISTLLSTVDVPGPGDSFPDGPDRSSDGRPGTSSGGAGAGS